MRFIELLKILNMSITKYNNYKYRIGESAETLIYGDYIILSIRDKILKQADVKKYPDIIKFVEKFTNDGDGKVSKNEHTMYMPNIEDIVNEAQSSGFIVDSKIDLLQCQYEYQYLYIFTKPN